MATWDSKYAHDRPRPANADASLDTALATPNSPSYPSEHAATAGAATAVLAYLFPMEAASFEMMAEEAGRSRVEAGVQFPSDVAAGLDLGRRVGALVIDRGRADGSAAPWVGSLPDDGERWSLRAYPAGATAVGPLVGTWQTWALPSVGDVLPPPPPAPGSAQFLEELAEVRTFARTFATNQAAFFWHPFGYLRWLPIAHQKVFEYRLDDNPPRAARVYALATVASYDAVVAVFHAKYVYYQPRPFQADPAVTTLFPTPAHPSYPAAHGADDGGWESVLAYLFPQDASFFMARAEEAASSRIWAGIHYRSDTVAGLALGRAAGRAVVERARSDGAE